MVFEQSVLTMTKMAFGFLGAVIVSFLSVFMTPSASAGERMKCEMVLVAQDDKIWDLWGDAYTRLATALDEHRPTYSVSVVSGVTELAAREFNLRNINATFAMRAFFSAPDGPEIEIFQPALGAVKEQFVTLIGGRRTPLYFWKRLKDKIHRRENESVEELPDAAEVGWVSAPMTQAGAIRRFVSLRSNLNKSSLDLIIGIDVDCNRLWQFTANTASTHKLIWENGILCRVPVITARLKRPVRALGTNLIGF